MARVSIIIPCYNAAPWLAETLESALGQTHPDKEIIVIDDGSRDESVAIASTFEHRGIRLEVQPNRGAAAARNHGLRLATGDFIQFLDADDLLDPHKIERQLQVLTKAPAGSIASCPWGRFAADPRSARFVPEPNWEVSNPVEWLCHNFAGRGMMPPIAWLTPRSLIQQAGEWDERLSLNDDGEYFCRVLLAGTGIIFCPAAKAYYRSNVEGSLSRRTSRKAWQSALLSHELSARSLQAAERSKRTNLACADLYQRLAFTLYPDCPDLVTICENRARSHGGSQQRPGGGFVFKTIAACAGWKMARRLQEIISRRRITNETESAL